MAGYLLRIQLDPFRMNNITIRSVPPQESHYKNGIIYSLNVYPSPIVPWIGKTIYDILQESNDLHGGGLSGFIALIDAMPALFGKLNATSFDATTLFVPTNEASVLCYLSHSQLMLLTSNFLQSCHPQHDLVQVALLLDQALLGSHQVKLDPIKLRLHL